MTPPFSTKEQSGAFAKVFAEEMRRVLRDTEVQHWQLANNISFEHIGRKPPREWMEDLDRRLQPPTEQP